MTGHKSTPVNISQYRVKESIQEDTSKQLVKQNWKKQQQQYKNMWVITETFKSVEIVSILIQLLNKDVE